MTVIPFTKPIDENNDFKVTEVELVYRNKQKASERSRIRTSVDAYNIFLKSWDDGKIELQEQFKVMLLDRKNGCLGISTVSSGGLSDCIVDLRFIFATAIKANAANIILAHNHPSGNLTPSEPDKKLTQRFADVGKLMDIHVLDHIIVTKDGYTSFADEGFVSQPLRR